MKIIGLGGSSHDFSACLLVDGEIVCAIEEERITRIKHSMDMGMKIFRCKAVDYCLEVGNVSIEEIDAIIVNDLVDPRYYMRFNNKIEFMNHHLSHATSSYYLSNFEESAILVVDGYGSCIDAANSIHETVTLYRAKNKEITELKKNGGKLDREYEQRLFENSLGMFYLTVTLGVGFDFLQEGKTMGLAAYGEDKYIQQFAQFYEMTSDNVFIFSQAHREAMESFIRHELDHKEEHELLKAKADLAFACQYHLEEILIQICNELYEKTGTSNLCLAGGVFLNSVANYKILERTPFEHIFILPATGDAGTAIGSALYKYHNSVPNAALSQGTIFSPYTGRVYDESSINEAIQKYSDQIIVEKIDQDLLKHVAYLISRGNIIGFFQGGSEIGPRALGNRSILADPRNASMKDIINKRIKHREAFRPFAPIVIDEKQNLYFEMEHPSHYMLLISPIKQGMEKVIPAVTHNDGTGRVQTIHKELTPTLYRLLESFESLTGVPVLLNTSFNDNGEPMVETPNDAISCFLNIDLDYLVLGDKLIVKK